LHSWQSLLCNISFPDPNFPYTVSISARIAIHICTQLSYVRLATNDVRGYESIFKSHPGFCTFDLLLIFYVLKCSTSLLEALKVDSHRRPVSHLSNIGDWIVGSSVTSCPTVSDHFEGRQTVVQRWTKTCGKIWIGSHE
jgi:hypothetical protein